MKQARVPTEAEMKRLLATIAMGKHAERNRAAISLSYYGGLRVGEIAALVWGDVVDREGRVREVIQLRAETTKTDDSRAIFVSERLRKELTLYVKSLKERPAADAPFLLTQQKTAFSPNTMCKLFGHLYQETGLDGASSHSGRRWFITKLAHSGISPKVIMELAGHANLSTTQRYIDCTPDMMKAAVEVL